MGMRIPPLKVKITLASNPLQAIMLVGGLDVCVYMCIRILLSYYSIVRYSRVEQSRV